MKKWKINVFHLSHTDIGYTETQARILQNQVNYLRDLVKDYKAEPSKFDNWFWTAENFFIVEQFLNEATPSEIKLFVELVNKKTICLSATYLNINELANKNIFNKIQDRIQSIMKEYGLATNSMVTNDVNGYSYGYATSIANHGIENLFFGLHTHHGMFPAFKKQHPFIWKTADGKELFVWVGEHYQVGNEFGFVGNEIGNYILQSNFPSGRYDEKELIKQGGERMVAYLKGLDDDGYPFINVPISVLGAGTDNAPYNLDIRDRIHKINETWSKEHNIEVEMVTLETFFENVKSENKEVPTYSGDWPDWWSDGVGSTPEAVRLFRTAQRRYELISSLNIKHELISELEKNLMLFAEHTWGAWSSIEDPFSFWNKEITFGKNSFVSLALSQSQKILDDYSNRKVHKLMNEDIVKISIENPFETNLKRVIHLNEFLSNDEMNRFKDGFFAKQDGLKIETYTQNTFYMNIPQPQHYAIIEFKNSKKAIIELSSIGKNNVIMTHPTSKVASDKIVDVYNPLTNDDVVINDYKFENDFVSIQWNDKEIVSLFDRTNNIELLSDEQEGLFTPIYEYGEIPYQFELMNLHRRHTGRNRKTDNTVLYKGHITNVKVISDKKQASKIEFLYDVKGTKMYKLTLDIVNSTRTISANIKIAKETEWSYESLYISLPFAKDDSKVKFDKGEMIEIWKDQIPGTLIDYYSIQEGIKIEGLNSDVLISTLDNNLFWTGSMKYQKRFLAHDERNTSKPVLYAWVMNNVWETNFQASLGGFHEFNYSINIPGTKVDDATAIMNLKVLNDNILKTRLLK